MDLIIIIMIILINTTNQVKEEEVVGHPRSFALFDSPARVPRADRSLL